MLKQLYDYIEKFNPGNVYTIAARPGMGKTIVARYIANMLAESGQNVLYIETEGLPEQERLKRLNDKYDFLYRRLISAEEIRNVAFIGKYNVIVIDSFQYMHYRRKEDVAYKLKRLAEELKCAVIVLSYISRKADMRKSHRPRITDMARKICGTLWKTSDVIIFLWRDAYYERYCTNDAMNFLIAQNIGGKLGKFKVNFKKLIEIWDSETNE